MEDSDKLENLHTNQRILAEALIKKGASVFIEDLEKEIIRVRFRNRETYFLDRFNQNVPYNWVVLTASKIFVKNLLLQNNIAVPLGDVFTRDQKTIAIPYAKALGFPLVFKPDWGSHGDNVFVDIRSETELRPIVSRFLKNNPPHAKFILEEYFEGTEHRIFITQKGQYAVLRREPAHIIGDGIRTIQQIIAGENQIRQNLKETVNTSLCPLTVDSTVLTCLQRRNLSLQSVIPAGQKIYLRLTSNIAKGGTSRNVTALVHPSVIKIARKVMRLVPLPFMGIDFICKDITQKQTPDSYRIVEINSSPGFAMHMLPTEGEAVNVGEYAANVLLNQRPNAPVAYAGPYSYNPDRPLNPIRHNVFAVLNPDINGNQVIKLLLPDAPDLTRQRFAREIRNTLELHQRHPGLIPILDYDHSAQPCWYTMPRATGIRRLTEQQLSLPAKISCLCQIAETLSALHREGIAHRDIKPDNILFCNGQYKLADLELLYRPHQTELLKPGRPVGPSSTIAPEMSSAPQTADYCKADVYSFGKTLWIFLTGNFNGFHDIEAAIAAIKTIYDGFNTSLIQQLIRQTTEKDPAARPDMAQIVSVLQQWLQEQV